MKKYIIALVAVVTVMGTQTTFAAQRTDQKMEMRMHKHNAFANDSIEGKKDGRGPRGGHRGPGPRIQATEGCTCKTCQQIRQMEERMKQMREQQGDKPLPRPEENEK